MTLTQTSDTLLRSAIRLDGVVVAALGIGMIALAATGSTLTGLPAVVEYVAGALSIAYGPAAFYLAAQPRVRPAGMALGAVNVLTTVALVVLVATGIAGLTGTGNALALAVAAYTAAIGGLQLYAARVAA